MYRYLAKGMEVILKAVLDVSKYMFIVLLLMVVDNIKDIAPKEINNVFLYCLIMYLFINLIVTNICKFDLNKYIKMFISICIIGISIIIPILFINKKWDMYTLILSINFLCISTKSILYANKGMERDFELTNFMYSLGACITIFTIMFFFEETISPAYIECTRKYLSIYFIIGVMSIARLNLVDEYKTSHSITINKDKNVVRVNIISCILVILAVTLVSLEYVKKCANFVFIKTWVIITTFLGDIFTGIVGEGADKIKYAADHQVIKKKPAFVDEGIPGAHGSGKLDEVIRNYIPEQVRDFSVTHAKVIVTILVIAFIIIIGYIIYKNLNRKSKVKEVLWLDEEKNFIFSLNDLKDVFKNLTNKIQDSLNNKRLHPIRKAYIECVVKLNENGIKHKASYTPNEYSKIIQKNYSDKKEFGTITEFYNNLRYGNKQLTDEEITRARQIAQDL